MSTPSVVSNKCTQTTKTSRYSFIVTWTFQNSGSYWQVKVTSNQYGLGKMNNDFVPISATIVWLATNDTGSPQWLISSYKSRAMQDSGR
jgi:hypothetical protein